VAGSDYIAADCSPATLSQGARGSGLGPPRRSPTITPELKHTIAEGVFEEAGNRSVEQLAKEENELLIGLLRPRGSGVNGGSERKAVAACLVE
jgi:hypothetical protein